jgi:zinc protease
MGDASGATFYFVGNFNLDSLKYYVSIYLANLPSTGKVKNWKDTGARAPMGKIEKIVKKGIAPKSYVLLRWNMPFEFNAKGRNEVYALSKLINIRLREVLREDKSGVYGVNFSATTNKYPIQKLENVVGFNCKPENVDSLIAAVWQVINEVKANGCDDKNLEKIKQTFIRERETALKENSFWIGMLMSYDKLGESIEQIDGYNDWVNSLNGKDFVGFADKYFKTDNYAKLILMPEN